MSLFFDCLTLGDGLSVLLCYMQLETFETKFEIFEVNCSHIEVLVCAADVDVLG